MRDPARKWVGQTLCASCLKAGRETPINVYMENGTSRRAFARCKGEEVPFACDHADRYSVEATALMLQEREQAARENPDPKVMAEPDSEPQPEQVADTDQPEPEQEKGARHDWSDW